MKFGSDHRLAGHNPATLLLVLALALMASCSVDVTTVAVDRVEVLPASVTLPLDGTSQLSARLTTADGDPLTGRPVTWRSLNPSVAVVDAAGMVRGVGPGSTTVEAASEGVTGTASITVQEGPILGVSPAATEFAAVQNGATPGDRTIAIQNVGDGVLNGLNVSISYPAGQPTGWLAAALSGSTAPASLVLSANQGALAPGTYTATVVVTAAGASNSPVTIPVALTVQVPPPAIALGATELNFAMSAGGAAPAAQSVGITNAGGGTLSGLSAMVTYAPGQPTGWLEATLSAAVAPTSLTVRVTNSSLPSGTYSATVLVNASGAQNSPQQVTVALVVGTQQPSIGASPGSVSFQVRRGQASASQAVAISNAGGGVLNGLGTTVIFPGGQPTGWLTATLSGAAAPATLTVTAAPASLPPGTYSATVRVTAATAPTRDIPVQLEVTPAIPLAPGNLTATASADDAIHVTWTDRSDDEDRFEIQRSSDGGSNWATPITLPAGSTSFVDSGLPGSTTMSYRVRACNQDGCSAYAGPASATTAPSRPAWIEASAVSEFRIDVSWLPASGDQTGFVIERRLAGMAVWVEVASVAAQETAYADNLVEPGTTYEYQIRACRNGLCSRPTGPATATTPALPQPPPPPAGLTATAVSSSSIELAWTLPASALSFEIQRAPAAAPAEFTDLVTLGGAARSFADTGLPPSSEWLYRVRACNDDGCSPFAGPEAARTGPAAPSGVVAAATSPTQVELGWTDNSTDATSFVIERSLDGSGEWAEVDRTGPSTTNYTDAGVAPATTYSYRVSACRDGICSEPSAPALVTTPEVPPSAPTNLQAVAVSSSAIELNWAQTGSVLRFEVQRASGAAPADFADLTEVGGGVRSLEDTGLPPSSEWLYRVRACNSGGCSDFTAAAGARTGPAAPSGLAAVSTSPTTVELSWTDNSTDATTFVVERTPDAADAWAEVGQVAAGTTTWTDTSVAPSTSYRYRVRACRDSVCSSPSAPVQVTTLSPPPPAPTGMSAVALSSSAIEIVWSHAGGADRFEVQRAGGPTPMDFADLGQADGSERSYVDTDLPPSSAWLYQVRACNAAGCSAYAGPVSARTGPAAPTGLAAVAVAPEQVNLEWTDASSDATSFVVERAPGGTQDWEELAQVPASESSFSDASVEPATTYVYRVRACRDELCSPPAGPVEASTPPVAPPEPSGLEATSLSLQSARLDWSHAGGATSFEIQRTRQTNPNGFTTIGTADGAARSFTDGGLIPFVTYLFRVRACVESVCSAWAGPVSVTPPF